MSCRLKKNAVPSIFFWVNEESELAAKRKERAANRCLNSSTRRSTARPSSVHFPEAGSLTSNQTADCVYYDNLNIPCESQDVDIISEGIDLSPQDIATQTDQVDTSSTYVQTSVKITKGFSVQNYCDDPKGIHFYTGLESYEKFEFVLETLGQAAYNLICPFGSCSMDVENQYFATLIKLRLNKTYFELSRMFLVSESEMYGIICMWVRFMSLQWRELDIFPSKACTGFYAPSDFKKKFPFTRVIVDGTEIPIKKPKKPTAQQATFSTYKNRNTVKTLIGTSPSGMVTYVSECYGGSTSDRQIIERSDLALHCNRGDSIMADKGFDVQDLLAPYGIHVNMPAFFSKINRIPGEVVRKDRKIASKRVHVERSIGLGKTYKILTSPLCHSEVLLSSDIVFICFMLCNMRENIVGPNA